MFAAARWLDPLTHDMITPCGLIAPPITGPAPGNPVLIEFLPAAYVTSSAVCMGVIAAFPFMIHPPLPIPPPIVKGSLTVMINGMPAARWTPSMDVAGCGCFLGNPLMIAMRKVLIGD